jgi:HAD superfamily hydrolase (TIGR01484 family)
VATDLDGTLLRPDGTVSERTRAALARATAAGAAHVVVTGRPASRTRGVLDALGYEGLAVCGQGGELYHAGEHRLVTCVTLDRAVARAALERIETVTGPLAVGASRCGVDGAFLAGPGYHKDTALPVLAVADRTALWDEPITRAYVQHPDPERWDDDRLTATARAAVGGLVDVVLAGPHIVELVPPGLTKATGLRLAARRLGATAAGTVAFGDMPNDIPMLAWAGLGVAMANAHPEVLAAADEVTGSDAEDGVAAVLERLFGDAAGGRAAEMADARAAEAADAHAADAAGPRAAGTADAHQAGAHPPGAREAGARGAGAGSLPGPAAGSGPASA